MGQSEGENFFCNLCNSNKNDLKGPPVRGSLAKFFSFFSNAFIP